MRTLTRINRPVYRGAKHDQLIRLFVSRLRSEGRSVSEMGDGWRTDMQLRSRIVQVAATLLVLLAVLALLQTKALAQATGTVAGTVADQTGAVIPNAVVVL